MEEMIKHTNVIVECKVILSDKEIEWFESKKINVKLLEEYKIDENGNRYWYKNGEFDRENDLPAIIFSNGNKYWYKNGKFHRDNDLPAVILARSGRRKWYKNGNRYSPPHRNNNLHLPAIIYPSR
jgi:hypothetical protein